MVLRPRPVGDRGLTGQRRTRIGIFGILIAEVEISSRRGTIWVKCQDQWEWDWCDQFEQKVKP